MKDEIKSFLLMAVVYLSIFISLFLAPSLRPDGHLSALSPSLAENLVLNLTFDTDLTDYSSYNHIVSAVGGAAVIDTDTCKWYGCLNVSLDNGDYINFSTGWQFADQVAVSYWLYVVSGDGDGHYAAGLQGAGQHALFESESTSYGMSTKWAAENGEIAAITGESNSLSTGTWYHMVHTYDGNNHVLYQNGDVVDNDTDAFGNLNLTQGVQFYFGRFYSENIDLIGYMDEILIYNKSLSSDEVQELYDATRLGTPPELEVAVTAINYTLPFNWSHNRNELQREGQMNMNITIENFGTNATGDFDWNVTLGSVTWCSGTVSLSGQSTEVVNCIWNTSMGFHQGYVNVDVDNVLAEDDETNNAQYLLIPYLDRPWMIGNQTKSQIEDYCYNSSNSIAYTSCDWTDSFLAEDFNTGWTGNSVDPRGKKGRESAIGCWLNNYTSSTQCERAYNHLYGWGNRTLSGYSDVQAIHELFHVASIYDFLQPNMTEAQNDLISKQYYDICQHITTLDNTQPYNDNQDQIAGGNGKGFGSGMGGFCYLMSGAYKDNPTMMVEDDQLRTKPNAVEDWMIRELNYLRAMKNDSYTKYQEGILYKWYSQSHIMENFFLEKFVWGLDDLEPYNNAFCAMGREAVTELLDFTYDGNSLRSDEPVNARSVQRGDTNSYETYFRDYEFQSGGALHYYILLCDDQDVKNALLYTRELYKNSSDSTKSYLEVYLDRLSRTTASATSPEQSMPKIMYDNANDIFTIRTNYSYVNDTVIQIDGGEERGGGHSQAQGYYLYALGEPFIDQEQVPLEDDVRAETWKNGISLQNTSQTTEGTGGTYSATCGNAPINQYYGMGDCTAATFSSDYPDYRLFPLEYGGDNYDYIGTADATFSGIHVHRPYTQTSDGVHEYFIKYGDTLVKRSKVDGVTQGEGVYHNFINLYNETNLTSSGVNFTLSRFQKHVDTKIVYDEQGDLTLNGGASGLTASATKTGSAGLNVEYRRMFLHTDQTEIDLIFSHHWYTGTNAQAVTALNSSGDGGLLQSNRYILFDTSEDNKITSGNRTSDGWGLVYDHTNKEAGCFNCTSLNESSTNIFASNDTMEVFIEKGSDEYKVWVNTMERNTGIDYPKKVRVTVDASDLTDSFNFSIKKEGTTNVTKVSESGDLVTFDVQGGQIPTYYSILGNVTGAGVAQAAYQCGVTCIIDKVSVSVQKALNLLSSQLQYAEDLK